MFITIMILSFNLHYILIPLGVEYFVSDSMESVIYVDVFPNQASTWKYIVKTLKQHN